MEKISSFPYTFKLGDLNFEISDGRVIWTNAEGVESRVVLDGKIQNIAIFEDKIEYVMTAEYPDGIYCISHNNGIFGPFKEINNIYYDDDKIAAIVSGIQGNTKGEFTLLRPA